MTRSVLMLHLERALGRARRDSDAPPCASRRRFLQAGAGLVAASAWPPLAAAARGTPLAHARVAIVGGGLAGLTALYTLAQAGIRATLYEATPRLGGRCWSERRAFAPQVAERGGEFIDSSHAEIRALAAELDLPLDDVLEAQDPDTAPLWWLDGAPYTLAQATADLHDLLPTLDADAAVLGDDGPSYRHATPAQRALDRMSAATWIVTRVPGGGRSRLGRLLANAYTEELGADPDDISAVSVVALLQETPRDALSPYAESDQRFHVRGGNDQLVAALARGLDAHVQPASPLAALTQDDAGRCRLAFLRDGAMLDVVADHVILALPFSLLREVDLARARFGPRKRLAIRTLGMGRNTKLQLQFATRHWRTQRGNGETRLAGTYVTSWEVTRAQDGTRGILNFFSGGSVAARAGAGSPEEAAQLALADLEAVHPGSTAQWTGAVIRNAWDRHPWTRGSYSLLMPGQYTAFHGTEWEPEGRVHFAGEHTSATASGYLNGAVESGQRAAREVVAALLRRRAA